MADVPSFRKYRSYNVKMPSRYDTCSWTTSATKFDRFIIDALGPDIQALRILAVGCATGRLLQGMANAGARHLSGADPAPRILDVAAAKLAKTGIAVNLRPADAEDRLPWDDASFDVVTVSSVLHHFFRPRDALAEIHRVLRPRGRLLVMDPCFVTPIRQTLNAALCVMPHDGHSHFFAPGAAVALLRESGFDVQRVERIHWSLFLVDSVARQMSSLSVIIPAFNEADYIGSTLECLAVAARPVKDGGAKVEIAVVDNASTDRTAAIAAAAGARIVQVQEHNISKVRNAGAAVAAHDVFVFLDADTLVPPPLLARISRTMAQPTYAGGAVDIVHRPRRLVLRAYLGFWRALGLLGGMAQGACQFCRRDVFQTLRGYDESQFMGEDVDFHWRLRRLARQRGWTTSYVRELQVMPSPRRFDRWPLWRTIVWTNPLVAFALRRRRGAWRSWYVLPPR